MPLSALLCICWENIFLLCQSKNVAFDASSGHAEDPSIGCASLQVITCMFLLLPHWQSMHQENNEDRKLWLSQYFPDFWIPEQRNRTQMLLLKMLTKCWTWPAEIVFASSLSGDRVKSAVMMTRREIFATISLTRFPCLLCTRMGDSAGCRGAGEGQKRKLSNTKCTTPDHWLQCYGI